MKIKELLELIKGGESDRVEFKKTFTNEIGKNIVAFANTDGGIILIGVADDGSIVGAPKDAYQRISDLLLNINPPVKVKIEKITIDDSTILILHVPKSDRLHMYRNIAYIRVGKNVRPLDIQEIVARAAESTIYYFDRMPTDAPIDEIDWDLIRWYLQKRKEVRGIGWFEDLKEIAKKLDIIVKRNGTDVLSLAGLLFFSKNPNKYIPWARIQILKFLTNDMTKASEVIFVEGSIWKIIEETMRIIQSSISIIPILGGRIRRKDVPEYPLEALREAIINALAHRNYLIPSEVQIFITPSMIKIRNPGSFPPGVTPENPKHVPRNPLICQFLFDTGYIEKWGTGIIRMRKACEEHPLVNLRFVLMPFYTEVIFEKVKDVKEIIDEIDRKILEFLRRIREASSSQIARELGLSKPAVINRLKRLISLGLIGSRGSGPKRRYYVIS